MPKKSFPPRDAPRRDAGRSITGSPGPTGAAGGAPTDTDTPPLGIGLRSSAGAGQQSSTDAGAAPIPPGAGLPPETDDGPAVEPRAPEPPAPEPPAPPAPTSPEPPDPTRSDPPQADPPTVEQPVIRPSQPPAWAGSADQPAQLVRPPHPADPQPVLPVEEVLEQPPPAARRRGLRPPGPGRRTPQPDRQARQRLEQVARVRRALTGSHQVAVVSLKGGVGRTTVSALLGLTLAEHREDRVIVVDSTPAGGTLSDRLTGATGPGIRDLLDRLDVDDVHSLADIERFSGAVGNLRVLGSDQDLTRNLALNGLEYERLCLLLQRHFPVIVTDGATGPALPATLALAHGVVVVGSFTVDGAGRAGKTLDWLLAHGYRDLAGRALLVLDGDRASDDVDAARLREHFATRFRAVVEIPHDRHLAQGGRIDATALAAGTRDAVLELAALVADEFGTVTAGRR